MTIVLEVPSDVEEQIREEAARRGKAPKRSRRLLCVTPLKKMLPVPASTQPRIAGLNAGPMWISEDFDAPLPDAFWLGNDAVNVLW